MDVASSTLTPLRFLQRSEDVWAERPAVRDGARAWTYAEHGERVRRAAGALRDELGIAEGDRVAILLPNVAAALELHYAVPGARGVLVPLNTRLAAGDYAYILDHAERARVVAHPGRREVLEDALERMEGDRPRVIWSGDEYEALLAAARAGRPRAPRGRACAALDQLHVGDHRAAEGRDVPRTAAPTCTRSASSPRRG